MSKQYKRYSFNLPIRNIGSTKKFFEIIENLLSLCNSFLEVALYFFSVIVVAENSNKQLSEIKSSQRELEGA